MAEPPRTGAGPGAGADAPDIETSSERGFPEKSQLRRNASSQSANEAMQRITSQASVVSGSPRSVGGSLPRARRNSSGIALWGAPKQPLPTVASMLSASSASASLPSSSLEGDGNAWSVGTPAMMTSPKASTNHTVPTSPKTNDNINNKGVTDTTAAPYHTNSHDSVEAGAAAAAADEGDIEDLAQSEFSANHDDDLLEELVEANPRVPMEFVSESPSLPEGACPCCYRLDCPTTKPGVGFYSPQQVIKHNSPGDAWITAHGNVYDVSRYMAHHPGGAGALLKRAGHDATRDYDFHSKQAHRVWQHLQVGRLVTCPYVPHKADASFSALLSLRSQHARRGSGEVQSNANASAAMTTPAKKPSRTVSTKTSAPTPTSTPGVRDEHRTPSTSAAKPTPTRARTAPPGRYPSDRYPPPRAAAGSAEDQDDGCVVS